MRLAALAIAAVITGFAGGAAPAQAQDIGTLCTSEIDAR